MLIIADVPAEVAIAVPEQRPGPVRFACQPDSLAQGLGLFGLADAAIAVIGRRTEFGDPDRLVAIY